VEFLIQSLAQVFGIFYMVDSIVDFIQDIDLRGKKLVFAIHINIIARWKNERW